MPPEINVTVSLIEPEPEAEHVEPDDAEQVQVAPVRAAGNASVTVAATASEGPLLVATIVYVTLVPGTSADAPSVLVIDRSAVRTSVSVSVEVLFETIGSVTPLGTETLAVLIKLPVAFDATVADMT